MLLKQVTETDDSIHRSADVVRHIEEERGLCTIRSLSLRLCPFQFGVESRNLLKVVFLILIGIGELHLMRFKFIVELLRLLHGSKALNQQNAYDGYDNGKEEKYNTNVRPYEIAKREL